MIKSVKAEKQAVFFGFKILINIIKSFKNSVNHEMNANRVIKFDAIKSNAFAPYPTRAYKYDG